LGDHTIGEIMSLRAFGPRCLVDLLSAQDAAAILAVCKAEEQAAADGKSE